MPEPSVPHQNSLFCTHTLWALLCTIIGFPFNHRIGSQETKVEVLLCGFQDIVTTDHVENGCRPKGSMWRGQHAYFLTSKPRERINRSLCSHQLHIFMTFKKEPEVLKYKWKSLFGSLTLFLPPPPNYLKSYLLQEHNVHFSFNLFVLVKLNKKNMLALTSSNNIVSVYSKKGTPSSFP